MMISPRMVLSCFVIGNVGLSIMLSIKQAMQGYLLSLLVQVVVMIPCAIILSGYWWRNRDAIHQKFRSWGL